MEFHHLGCIVENIESTVHHYLALLGSAVEVSTTYEIEAQEVKVCFMSLGNGSWLELVESVNPNSTLNRMRKKKGISFYHLGFQVDDIEQTISELETQDYRLLNRFSSEAFQGRTCCFLFTPEMHLIELIQK